MNQTKSTSKKLLALLLALIMTVSLLPMSVFAAEPGTDEAAQKEVIDLTGGEEETEDVALTEEGEGDVTLPEESAEDAEPEEDTEPEEDVTQEPEADTYAAEDIAVQAATDSEFQYKILHLDCGRKYFSKNWIIALLYEMKDAGYNQLQLAFGNKGLRFLLNDMSVTVDGTTYSSQAVTEAIQVGNKTYFNAGEKNELTQTEMGEIITAANTLGIQIVPLFNTPFHMEAVITAMQQLEMGNVYYGNEKGCLDLSNNAAKEFVKALMKKYVDYFAGKGCKFFNFGADEYKGVWNDTFYTYANSIAEMIKDAGMKARVFNDSFRRNSSNKINNVQVCYWTSGSDYATTQNVRQSAEVINTNQDFYYVVNKDETVQSNWTPDAYYTFVGTYGEDWITQALKFTNTTYKNHGNTNNGASSVTPIGSMFCVWSDNPGDKTETQIAQEIRMILRVMAARMDNRNDYSTAVVTNGFNVDGTINGGTSGGETGGGGTEQPEPTEPGTTVEVNVAVGDTVTKTVDGRYSGVLLDNEYATVSGVVSSTGGDTKYNAASPAVGEFYVSSKSNDTAPKAQLTFEDAGNGKYYIKVNNRYVYPSRSDKDCTLEYDQQAVTVSTNKTNGSVTISSGSEKKAYLALNTDGNFMATRSSTSAALYLYTKGTTNPTYETTLTFTGVKPGKTSYKIGGVTYNITVEAKTVNVTLEVGDSTTFNVGSSKISKSPDPSIATAAWNDGVLTLTGVAASDKTTECIVGDTKYVIKVVKESSGTDDSFLYVDLWVTNHGVKPDTSAVDYTVVNGGQPTDTGARRVTLEYEADKFASPEGLSVSEFLPSTGKDTANETRVAIYWKTRYLPQSTRQTMDGWTNKSGYGTDVRSGKAGGLDIERVRYYGGTWAYLPVGGTDWVNFTTAESDAAKAAVTKDDSGAQIAAFYMLETEVTKEVTTYVTDWSDEVSNDENKWIFGVALDYCVKFEGDTSTRYPRAFGKTATPQSQWFNCQYGSSDNDLKAYNNGYTLLANEVGDSSWKGNGTSGYYRVINNIQAVETEQYEVYMITTLATEGNLSTVNKVDSTRYDMPASINYPDEYSKEKVIWAIDEKTATDSGLEKHDEYKQGGTPDVSRVVIQRGTGMLLTYYVRAKATTADKVTVEYYENSSNVKFYGFDILTGKYTPNTFADFQWDDTKFNQTTYEDPWKGNHYICNSDGKPITINSDLALVSGLAAKYKAGGFTLTRIERSEDNKTLKLYYDFTNSFTYVVDFGVPAKIERQSKEKVLKVTCGDKVLYDAAQASAKDVVEGKNGKLYMTGVDSIYYELTTMQYSGKPDTFTLTFTYQNSDNTTSEGTFNVTVIPASNVYYEDTNSFMKFENGQGVAGNAIWTEEFDTNKTAAIDSEQIAEIVGKENNNVYGYDPTYDNCTMFSLGRAHKVTVSADMVNNWNENSDAWPTAQFTFKGTGFDVISLTNDKSGLLTYKIEKQEDNGSWTTETQQFVINYYDYGYNAETGEWTKDTPQTLYQLPVIKADGLAYGTYRVTLTVAYGAIFDKTGKNEYSIWLDGVRIYDPAGPALNETYAKDGEGWAQYIELRDELVKEDTQRTALFIEDASENTSIEAYKNYGPNHEVYLLNNQAIAFQLANTTNIAKVQIGAKAPMGSATLKVNESTTVLESLGTATEMYYDITAAAKNGTVIITNGSTANDSILSLTQLKITYEKDPSTNGGEAELSILTEKEQQEVMQMVRAMYAPAPEPDPEPFAPERFEASWNRSTVKVGQKATLTVKTSEDVEAITVDGVTIDTYRTRTQRTGWGWNAKRVTYREFTYTITASEAGTLNCSVAALNAEGVDSEAITAALTVQAAAQRPGWGGWFGNLFGRWF